MSTLTAPARVEAQGDAGPGQSLDRIVVGGPAIAAHEGSVFVAWPDGDADGAEKLSVGRIDGSLLTSALELDHETDLAPSLASLADTFYVAWVGRDDREIYLKRSTDGREWSTGTIPTRERSESAPSLVALDGMLYLAWRGRDDRINVKHSADGIDWDGKVTLRETTEHRPSLTTLDGRLLLAWTGRGNRNLNVLRSSDGLDWGAKAVLDDERALHGPELVHFNDELHLIWIGMDGKLNARRSENGLDWPVGKVQVGNETSSSSPSIAILGDEMYLAWATNDGGLMLSRTPDGMQWRPPGS